MLIVMSSHARVLCTQTDTYSNHVLCSVMEFVKNAVFVDSFMHKTSLFCPKAFELKLEQSVIRPVP